MIKPKKKICKLCQKEKYIFSKGRCLECTNRFNAKIAIAKSPAFKPKKVARKKLVEELDKVFSLFIRQRTADDNGMVKCFTCQKRSHWKEMDCGHYWSRRYVSTRWDETNCQVQCKGCNIFNQGAGPQFALALIEKYGQDSLTMLEVKKNNTSKMDSFQLGVLIKHYSERIQQL